MRFVEGVKMDSNHIVMEQIQNLLCGPVDANFGKSLIVVDTG